MACNYHVFLVLAALPFLADASAFRGRVADLAATKGASPELERTLLSEIEEVLGSEHRRATEARLARIEGVLRPTFDALPKNKQGRLGHAGVRYAMHRLFVQRHGWYIQGLEPKGQAWNSSSPTVILEEGLPAYIQSLFEKRVGGNGFNLHELAVMAATLENLVHKESMDRLEQTYTVLERSHKDPVSTDESQEIIDVYMSAYILGQNFSSMTPSKVRESREQLPEVYPQWQATQKFVREVQQSVAPKRDELTYENIASVVEEIEERYGRWQDHECRALKQDLVAYEDHGTGRVRLADFYRAAMQDGKWQFSETIPYLRDLGALDETDPAGPSLIIPNYINSPSNCVAASNYYSVCCLDECEDILGHIEEKVGAPMATPAEISALVAALPSATVAGGRTLSPNLLQRLDEVAAHHGGNIPLHGRLFAQWLHHAYPRECSYPHATGTTAPEKAEEWMARTGQEPSATFHEMTEHVASYGSRPSSNSSSPAQMAAHPKMWTMEEELVMVHEHELVRKEPSSTRAFARSVAGVAAIFSMVVALRQTVMSATGASGPKGALLPTHKAKFV